MSRRALIVAAVIAVVAGGGFALWRTTLPGASNRESAVTRYMSAVSTGDEKELASIMLPAAVHDGHPDLVGIGGKKRSAPVVITSIDARPDLGENYIANVSGTENGSPFHTSLTLHDMGGRWFVGAETAPEANH
ncbi:hypothetical protein [Gephyromycinifex aptenodytis]|uniref:hypothetical protein n=1 Tax=Gephyromycinifex aptenodytis TaxID=2716227 RepID=UPI001444FFC6|nr:hypothetical protein [Gephyromycinifex aptenodytis]